MKTPTLEEIHLKTGSHTDPSGGVCLLEAVAWISGEKHSDHPVCVERVRGAFGRRLNDAKWPSDKDRTEVLRPLIPMLIGTAERDDSKQVAFFFADKAVREWAPMALEVRGRKDDAERLRSLPPVIDKASALQARDTARKIAAADAADASADAYAYAAAAAAADAAAAAADADAYAAADAADASADAYADAYAYAARLRILKLAAEALRQTCEPGFSWGEK